MWAQAALHTTSDSKCLGFDPVAAIIALLRTTSETFAIEKKEINAPSRKASLKFDFEARN